MATVNKSLNQPANGSNVNTWNVPVNNNFGFLDNALGGVQVLPANTDISSSPVTLTDTQYQNLIFRVTGNFTGTLRYNIPSNTGSVGDGVGGMWIIDNQTTGDGVLVFGTTSGSGTTITCPQSARTFIFSDGVNIRLASETQTGFLPEITLTNAITPTTLTGTAVNDWNPTGLGTTSVIRINASADATITGLAAQETGALMILQNVSTSYSITLVNSSSASSAANRFSFGSDYVIGTQAAVVLLYDGTQSRWVIVGNVQQTATQAQAVAGTDNSTVMTPLRVQQALGSGYRYLNTQIFNTAGSGTYTPTTGTKLIRVKGAGGGGGGGGAYANGSSAGAGGGGGGSGAFDNVGVIIDLTVGPITSIPYTIGAAGTAGTGTTNPTNGGAGGATTFGSAGAYLSLGGGAGGIKLKDDNSGAVRGGDGGTLTLGSNGASAGDSGGVGIGVESFDGKVGAGGKGGSTPFGGGGRGGAVDDSGSDAGLAGSGYGSGGGGGAGAAGGNAAGGAGRPGIIIVEEFV